MPRWAVDDYVYELAGHMRVCIRDQTTGVVVAHALTDQASGAYLRMRANAQLIAAAPTLFSACDALAEQVPRSGALRKMQGLAIHAVAAARYPSGGRCPHPPTGDKGVASAAHNVKAIAALPDLMRACQELVCADTLGQPCPPKAVRLAIKALDKAYACTATGLPNVGKRENPSEICSCENAIRRLGVK